MEVGEDRIKELVEKLGHEEPHGFVASKSVVLEAIIQGSSHKAGSYMMVFPHDGRLGNKVRNLYASTYAYHLLKSEYKK